METADSTLTLSLSALRSSWRGFVDFGSGVFLEGIGCFRRNRELVKVESEGERDGLDGERVTAGTPNHCRVFATVE